MLEHNHHSLSFPKAPRSPHHCLHLPTTGCEPPKPPKAPYSPDTSIYQCRSFADLPLLIQALLLKSQRGILAFTQPIRHHLLQPEEDRYVVLLHSPCRIPKSCTGETLRISVTLTSNFLHPSASPKLAPAALDRPSL